MVVDEKKKLVADPWDANGLVASHGAISSGILAGSNGGGSTKAPSMAVEGNRSSSNTEVRARARALLSESHDEQIAASVVERLACTHCAEICT